MKKRRYNKAVRAEERKSVTAKPTLTQDKRWRSLAKKRKRPHTAMMLDAMEEYMEKYEPRT